MARSLVAYYDSVYSAQKAVTELIDNGFSGGLINILVPDRNGKDSLYRLAAKREMLESEAILEAWGTGAKAGIGIGSAVGIAGAILVGLGSIHIPTLDASLTTGTISLPAVLLSGIAASSVGGAYLGGLIGRLLGLHIPEDEIRQYAKNVRQGKVLVAILAKRDEVDQAYDILNRHCPMDIKEETISPQMVGQAGLHLTRQAVHSKSREREDLR